MYNAKTRMIKVLCLPLFALPALLLAMPVHADSHTRIRGGIAIDTGDLRLYISNHHIDSFLRSDRYGNSHRANHRRDHYRSRNYQSGSYRKPYLHHYSGPIYRHQSLRDAYRHQINNRYYQRHEQRHGRRHNQNDSQRRYRHHHTHNDW